MGDARADNVVVLQRGECERAAELAQRLGVRCVREEVRDSHGQDARATQGDARATGTRDAFAMRYDDDGRLCLLDLHEKHSRGVCVRFDALPVKHGRIVVSRDDPLGRAFGDKVHTIIDATSGLGQDAFLLACMGFRVRAVERSAVLSELLRDGLRRALEDGRLRAAVDDRLTVEHADSIVLLDSLAATERPDAVYLDPMFPEKRKKSALAKKAIRMVRTLVGEDPDAEVLFDRAMRAATKRVVVKRADDAPPLARNPAASTTGKTVRYDVYVPGVSAIPELSI